MKKSELEAQLYDHPKFNVDRLYIVAEGKALTKNILWQYLCEIEGWKPLEVIQSSSTEWHLVASSSEIGLWHRTSAIHKTCDCQRYSKLNKPCCHLSAVMAHEESQWIARAAKYGFTVSVADGNYQVTDGVTGRHVGELHFEEGDRAWILLEDRSQLPMRFLGIDDAVEYLVAVASFGWQVANY